jgi:protein-disulfide isomerase
MIRASLLAALLAAGALAAPASAAPAAKAAAPDWSRTVAMTPEGGFRMGNPAAKVKVVEYGSLTCPHCADFSAAAKAPLAAAVRSGKVSFEFRNYVLNGIDVTATLLARCAGPANFFRLTESLYATQAQWVGKISGIPQAQKDQLKALPAGERLGKLADIGGLTRLAAQAGVAPQKGKACLADEAALDRLGKMGEAAAALGVEGTPTFFINGRMVHAHDWAELEPLIRQAGG